MTATSRASGNWWSTTPFVPSAGPVRGKGSATVPGGSLFRKGDTLRRALDAALSSPSGLGVAVDTDGKVAGVITAEEVLAVIESDRHVRQGAL